MSVLLLLAKSEILVRFFGNVCLNLEIISSCTASGCDRSMRVREHADGNLFLMQELYSRRKQFHMELLNIWFSRFSLLLFLFRSFIFVPCVCKVRHIILQSKIMSKRELTGNCLNAAQTEFSS